MMSIQYAPHVYSVFRLVFGALLMMNGIQTLACMFRGMSGDGTAVPLDSLFGVAGIIECLTGTLIMLGLFTQSAAFIASGMMAYAYFTVHQQIAPWPIVNRGEPAVMNCFAFLYMAARG